MAISFSDNIRVAAGKPSDAKYLNEENAPWVDTTTVLSSIPVAQRHIGLTVNVAGVEYWFKDNVNTLVQKGAELLDEDDFASNSNTEAATQQSIKSYIDPTITAVTGTSPNFTLVGTSPTNVFTAELTEDVNFGTVSGILPGKTYILEINNDENAVYPYQITFDPTFFSFDDGITPVLKSIIRDKKDYIIMYGIASNKLQIVDVIYGT